MTIADVPHAPARAPRPHRRRGLTVSRHFTVPGEHPFDGVAWTRRDAVISNEKGETVFEHRGCEFPDFWSQTAINVVVSKYFRSPSDSPDRETSLREVISRVCSAVVEWGQTHKYFAADADAQALWDELAWLLLHQRMTFNSPVWFNIGVTGARQAASACFINSVEDSMESILTLAKTEGLLFKGGSGTGTNLSPLRSASEQLAGGGTASGPVSFMKGFDAFAGVIKSGGTTRRAAKMVILNADHPDIEEFVTCKVTEEKKAWALIDAGYDGSFTGEAYASIFFQNSNNSVRLNDEFMRAVEADGDWALRAVTDGRIVKTMRARELMRLMAESAWQCGDPGVQYDTTINDWHTVPNSGRINASNPCAEFLFLDDTACNLASINLLRYLDDNDHFDVAGFRHTVDVSILAMEILVGLAEYPTERITENSRNFRPLGLGYANLGALLMALGLPYDSPAGQTLAGAITALMTGEAYLQSARIAGQVGPFAGFAANRDAMLRVIEKHGNEAVLLASAATEGDPLAAGVLGAAIKAWSQAQRAGEAVGYRNAQVTVLAPTGTISFWLDCDTTGVEPDLALVKFKKLVGGGSLKLVNQTVPRALRRLGYDAAAVSAIIEFITANDTIEGAPALRPEDVAVFDCAFRPINGERSIAWQGHLRMLAAVQPFLSGSVSKTVNLPSDATVEDIEQAYIDGWKMGLKCIAVYRDGCKRSQPMATSIDKTTGAAAEVTASVGAELVVGKPVRRRLPAERQALTHKFTIGGHEGYITVGMYEDGTPGEIFLKMAKEGSTVSGLMDSFATVTSMALQYGVPLSALINKFSHMRFEPQGFTGNKEIPMAKSLIDYIFRWLGARFLPWEERDALGIIRRDGTEPGEPPADEAPSSTPEARLEPVALAVAGANGNGYHEQPLQTVAIATATFHNQSDAPSCASDGSVMVRNGSCYKCMECGSTTGCG